MDTEIYGQIPIFAREQLRNIYAEAVKSNFDSFDPGELVEVGVMPFPSEEEIQSYDESVREGLEYVLGMIDESDAASVPPIFMIDTEKRDDGNKAVVWVVSNCEIATFTKTEVVHVSND